MSSSHALSLVLLAGIASAALAQQSPLGDGTGLQKNSPGLQRTSPGLQRDLQVPGTGTPRAGTYRDIAAEVRFRNAIITGNAPGGVSFRGRVGYTDPLDFRGRLGSDDLFNFRRDTLFSGAAGVGIRGTDAIQYQFAMTTGNVNPNYSAVNRGNESGAARAAEAGRPESALVTGSLRSSATFAAERALRPVVVGTRQPTAGTYERLIASSLTGLQYQPWQAAAAEKTTKPANSASPGALDLSVDRGVSPFDQSRERLQKSLESLANKATKPLDPAKPNEGVTTDPLSAIDKRLAEIRNALAPRRDSKKPDPSAKPAEPAKPATPPTLKDGQPQVPLNTLDPSTIQAIKDAGAKTDTLVPVMKVPGPADLYNQYMAEGQKLLAAQRFFDAEERYALALNARGGDLSAMVGRLHSQIGAGMRVSANINLRRLISEHPEVLGMTYDLALMGGKDRVDTLREQLRSQLSDAGGTSDTALVLAYLGRQRGEDGAADIQAGLDALARSQTNMPKDSPQAAGEARLIELLKGVWNAR